jgi:molecular chaperone Hsp33
MSASDHVQPFQLELPNLRGRMVRLGPALDAIITRHDYPPVIAQLLAEAVTLAALLSGMLKFDGIFTLQAKGNGAVGTLVTDITSAGHVRAYAQFSPEQLTLLGNTATTRDLLGNGYLAFTVDQGSSHERYQGLVELEGSTLTDFIQHYFRQSEQIDTAFSIAVCHDKQLGWQAGGLMLQRLPEESAPVGADVEDGWRRCMMLMSTLGSEELNDPKLPTHDLLYRLFHEEQVRVFAPLELSDRCRCSRERVVNVLRALSDEDISEMTQEGPAEVSCQFCARDYQFTAEEIKQLRRESDPPPSSVH